jgi:hypothetical protein
MTDAAAAAATPAAPPANAAEARTVLDARMGDKAWGAKLFAGDVATTTEYRDLRALINNPDPADSVTVAMSSQDLGMLPNAAAVELRGAAGYLREMGLNDVQVRETLEGKEPTAEEVAIARQWKAQSFKSQDFVKRMMAGEPDVRRQLLVANIILSSAKA